SSRVATVEKALADIGGTLESFYFAFGDTDVYVIAELPRQEAAVALAAAVGSSGSFSKVETVVLLTPAEIDSAMHQSVSYRPPGS
ncbi:MAG TPA: GYD domain-containing protein, partial [Acidothermaceae bacterium]